MIDDKGYSKLNLYLVHIHGHVTPATPDSDMGDGLETVLVAATSEDSARTVADEFEAGRIGLDVIFWKDKRPVACAYMLDADGNFL